MAANGHFRDFMTPHIQPKINKLKYDLLNAFETAILINDRYKSESDSYCVDHGGVTYTATASKSAKDKTATFTLITPDTAATQHIVKNLVDEILTEKDKNGNPIFSPSECGRRDYKDIVREVPSLSCEITVDWQERPKEEYRGTTADKDNPERPTDKILRAIESRIAHYKHLPMAETMGCGVDHSHENSRLRINGI